MTTKILSFKHSVNGVSVEQRRGDGYINVTAMSKAYQLGSGQRRDASEWLSNERTQESIKHLSLKTGIPVFKLIESKPGRYGGTFVHPRLAVRFAIWLSDDFGYLVEQWIEDWLLTGKTPVEPSVDEELNLWQQRYDIRIYLKDFLRPELMNVVIAWAEDNRASPITLCSRVHDTMNERIQGAKSQQIKILGGLPIGALIRDYFEASPLVGYSAINKLAINAIQDRGLDPVAAVHEACDHYLGKAYTPKLLRLVENVYVQGQRLGGGKIRRSRQLTAEGQLSIWDNGQAI